MLTRARGETMDRSGLGWQVSQASEGEIVLCHEANRVGEVAIDDEGPDPLALALAARRVLDPGFGQRDHGRSLAQARYGIDARRRVNVAADQIVASLDGDGVLARSSSLVLVAPWMSGVDGDQLVAEDEDLRRDLRRAAGQALDLDVREVELVVGVEEVGETVGVQADPAEDSRGLGVCLEGHHRSVG